MSLENLGDAAVEIWPRATALRDMAADLTVVVGDLAREVRDAHLQNHPPDRVAVGLELGNLVLASLRYMFDLGLALPGVLNAAAKDQAEYFSEYLDEGSSDG